MSLVSLEKYLYGSPSGPEHSPETSGSTGYYDLTCRLLAGIQDLLLAGKEVDDIGQDLHELRQSLHPDSETASLDLVAQRFESLLSALKTRSQQANHERSEDFRKIILILNEAFSL